MPPLILREVCSAIPDCPGELISNWKPNSYSEIPESLSCVNNQENNPEGSQILTVNMGGLHSLLLEIKLNFRMLILELEYDLTRDKNLATDCIPEMSNDKRIFCSQVQIFSSSFLWKFEKSINRIIKLIEL